MFTMQSSREKETKAMFHVFSMTSSEGIKNNSVLKQNLDFKSIYSDIKFLVTGQIPDCHAMNYSGKALELLCFGYIHFKWNHFPGVVVLLINEV